MSEGRAEPAEDTPQEKKVIVNATEKYEGDTITKIRQGCSIRVADAIRDPSRLGQLECDPGCGDHEPTYLGASRTLHSIEWPMR